MMDEEERRELAERIGARFPDALAGVDEVTSRAAIEAAGGDVDAEPVEREDYGDDLGNTIDVGDPLAGLGAAPAPSPPPAAAPVAQAPTAAPVSQRDAAPVATPATPATPDVRNYERHAVDLGAITRNPESAAGVESRQLNAADEEASRERRRARRLGIAGAVLSGIGLTPYGAIVGGAARMVGDDGRRKAADLRSQIAARSEAQQKQQEEERRALLAQIEARQDQANRDRDFALRQAALAARGDEFAAQQGLRTRSQDFREQQAELDRTAAERRARIIAGQRIGSGGGGGGGGAPSRPGGDVEVDGDVADSDALVIMSIIDERSAQLAPAVEAEVQRLRSLGVETTPEAVEWQLASNLFKRLNRKDQNAVRRSYAMPRSTTSEAAATDRHAESESAREEQHRVPGWNRAPDAPRLSSSEQSTARELASTYATMERSTRTMERLAREISALEVTAANAGALSDKMSEAAQVHEQLINQLRTIGNYGVPSGNEIERMEALAPRLTSRQWWTGSAPGTFAAMRRTLGALTADQMRSLGYSRSVGGGGAAAGGGTWRPVARSGDYIIYEHSRTGERKRRRR